MPKYRVSIGEVEHSGDVDLTTKELRKVDGVGSVRFEEYDPPFNGVFTVEYDGTRSEFRRALEDAPRVCF